MLLKKEKKRSCNHNPLLQI